MLKVAQTLFAGQEGVRLATDPVTGNLIALARPSQHATIRAIIKQMELETTQFAVIQLHRYDPQSLVLMLNKLLGKDLEENAGKGPTLDGDPTTMQLVVRGTAAEVAMIKEIVEELDPSFGADGQDVRSNARLIPLAGGQLTEVLDMADILWPTSQRGNRIRRVMPKNSKRSLDERGIEPAEEPKDSPDSKSSSEDPVPETKPTIERSNPSRVPAKDKSARFGTSRLQVRFVGLKKQKLRTVSQNEQADEAKEPDELKKAESEQRAEKVGAEIVVTIVPNGIIISSDDLDALDDYEELLRSLMGGNLLPPKPTIFYLKTAKAEIASALLKSILGLSSGGGGGGGIGGAFGDMASNLVGGVGGDLLGGLLGGMGGDAGGSSSLQTTGDVSITADPRLNVLVVQANAADLELIEELLEIIDQDSAPQDPETAGKTYIISVRFMPATEMANIVKQSFPENIAGAGLRFTATATVSARHSSRVCRTRWTARWWWR